MTQGKWSRLSPTQRADIWIRWKAGQTQHEIGRAYGKPHPTIRKVLLPRGGIPPIARRRSRIALTLAEREDLSRGIASGSSLREIARHLDRSASTVSRGALGVQKLNSATSLISETPRRLLETYQAGWILRINNSGSKTQARVMRVTDP